MVNEQVFKVHANCVYVVGAKRIAIYDLNGRIHLLDIEYKQQIEGIFNNQITESMLATDEKVSALCKYFIDKDLGFWIDRKLADSFADWNPVFVNPFLITNAIMDVELDTSFAKKFLRELVEINCPYIQIRFYKSSTASIIKEIISIVL